MYRRHKIGPRTDPCGTPYRTAESRNGILKEICFYMHFRWQSSVENELDLYNISASTEANNFKFGTQLGFAV